MQKSEAGAKLAQDVQYGTEEWQEICASDRNTIEGTNAFLKDGAHEGIGDAARRRMHGYTAQYVLITFLVAAGDLRKIDKFAREHLAPATPQPRPTRPHGQPGFRYQSSTGGFAPARNRKCAGAGGLDKLHNRAEVVPTFPTRLRK